MKFGTFFVTSALLIVMGALTACPSAKEQTSASQIELGNLQIQKALTLEGQLAAKYSIFLVDIMDPSGRRLVLQAMAQDYNWRRLSKTDRLWVKENLAEYLSLVEAILSLDARKGLFVTNKELVTSKRDGALQFQKNLEVFEKIVGENFEPKGNEEPAPIFIKSQPV